MTMTDDQHSIIYFEKTFHIKFYVTLKIHLKLKLNMTQDFLCLILELFLSK